MSSDNTVGEWYHNDLLGYTGRLPSPKFGLFYLKSLMDVIAADEVISENERKWVLGFAAISGYPDEVIDELKKYDPQNICQGIPGLPFNMDFEYVKLSRLSLIYNAFRAAGADAEIHKEEFNAICALGQRLGVSNGEISKIQNLYDAEVNLRKKRAAILVPKSLDTVLTE